MIKKNINLCFPCYLCKWSEYCGKLASFVGQSLECSKFEDLTTEIGFNGTGITQLRNQSKSTSLVATSLPVVIKGAPKETARYKEIRHIIRKLYKIKEIDRGMKYDIDDLRKLVFASKYGQEVIKDLNEKKVSFFWLRKNKFKLAADVLAPKLKIN